MRVSATVVASLPMVLHLTAGEIIPKDFVGSLVQTHQTAQQILALPDRDFSPQFRFLKDVVFHRQLASPRGNIGNKERTCDQSFLECLPFSKCIDCFLNLQTERIDWTSVSAETPCQDVVKFLLDGGHCTELKNDNDAIDKFCSTYSACVVWDDDGGGKSKQDSNSTLDCSKLETCNWPGMHKSFIGDGICHDNVEGCYNSEVCKWDGGDCCKDTCATISNFKMCGADGWSCRDPKSVDCDPKYTTNCENPLMPQDEDNQDIDSVSCTKGETKYRLIMYDSFGDGWDKTQLSIQLSNDPDVVIFAGGLKHGAKGERPICLSKNSVCYNAKVTGGIWGNEVSWEIKPLAVGAKSVANGGAPMDCDFGINGIVCPRTCAGSSTNIDPSQDKSTTTYEDVTKCVEEKCIIQIGSCLLDSTCVPCLTQVPPDFCFANDNFNAVVTCSLCNCMNEEGDSKKDKFCKGSGPDNHPAPPRPDENHSDSVRQCTGSQTMQGSNAVMAFAQCTDIDQVKMMVVDFDNEHFGALDTFERCCHEYAKEKDHTGRTAMSCMQMLKDAIDNPVDKSHQEDEDLPKNAISALAKHLFDDAEAFCSCSSTANKECPQCPSFSKFKILLNEALDACAALDEIDCAAWDEFQGRCKTAVQDKFLTSFVNFDSADQCEFIKGGCNVGPFPVFRKLDCGGEIPKPSWDFYTMYRRKCVGDSNEPLSPTPNPTPRPTFDSPTGTSPTWPAPTPAPTRSYVPDDDYVKGPTTPIPYSSSDDMVFPDSASSVSSKKGYNPDGTKKKSHFWRNLMFMGLMVGGVVAYTEYKKRGDNFSFVRYRQSPAPRDYGGSDMGMYSNVPQQQGGGATFQPPTLPPSDLDHL